MLHAECLLLLQVGKNIPGGGTPIHYKLFGSVPGMVFKQFSLGNQSFDLEQVLFHGMKKLVLNRNGNSQVWDRV